MNIDDIYTPIEEAKKEIWRRWNDKELKKKVEKFLGSDIPKFLQKEPRAIYTDYLASPDWSFFNFYEKSKEVGLKPIVWEYLDDIFVTNNASKVSLAKMVFYHGKDDYGDMVTSTRHIIDLSGKNEKRKIKDIYTLWDEKFVDFHHRALNEFYKEIEFHDGSEWVHKMGDKPINYYKYALALYIRNGILFENYLLSGKEKKFTKEILIPSFEFVKEKFGLKPLIVRLIPENEEENKYWWYYPEFIKILIDKKPKSE